MYVHHLKTLGGSCELLILWEWTDSRDGSINGGDVDFSSPDETLSTDSDLEEEDVGTDTVTFKCIRVTRDPSYQDILKSVSVSLKEGKHVPVQIEAEPTNPYDAHAVCFKCLLDSRWQVFSYVVKELCEEVNVALSDKRTTFASVKYKMVLDTMLPLVLPRRANGHHQFIDCPVQCIDSIHMGLYYKL